MNKVPMKFKKFLYFFMPKSEKIFYLYNDLSELHRRKPEHSVEDLKRQKRLFEEIRDLYHREIRELEIYVDGGCDTGREGDCFGASRLAMTLF